MIKLWFCTLAAALWVSCSTAPPESIDPAFLHTILSKIKANDLRYFTSTLVENRNMPVDTAKIRKTVARLHDLFSTVGSLDSFPMETKHSSSLTNHGILNLSFYIYRLQGLDTMTQNDPLYFWVAMEGPRLFDIGVAPLPPKIHFAEPRKTPHLDSFSLSIDSVSWFRIWYRRGEYTSEIPGLDKYYGMEGKYNRLRKCEVYDTLQKILTLLNTAFIDSLDHDPMLSPTTGDDAEYVSIRLKLTNHSYIKLNEFEILSCLSESRQVKEELLDYIIVLHSRSTRYLIRKESHPALDAAITHLARKEYGWCKEFNPD